MKPRGNVDEMLPQRLNYVADGKPLEVVAMPLAAFARDTERVACHQNDRVTLPLVLRFQPIGALVPDSLVDIDQTGTVETARGTLLLTDRNSTEEGSQAAMAHPLEIVVADDTEEYSLPTLPAVLS